jgi:hypothetical protein
MKRARFSLIRMLIVFTVALSPGMFTNGDSPRESRYATYFACAILGSYFVVGFILWLREILLREFRKPGFCQCCGYDLTGNVSGRCPECGIKINLH